MTVLEDVRLAATSLVAALDDFAARLAAGASEDQVYPAAAAALDRCLANLSSLGLEGQASRLPSSELWKVAGHYLERGWMAQRARSKPRGYAGDYELLASMYQSRLCDDALGRMLDRYFQEQDAPRAVRHRMQMIGDWIVESAAGHPHPGPLPRGVGEGSHHGPRPGGGAEPLKVAIVGSAFGLDVRDALARLDEQSRQRLHVVLLDLDPAAIAFAREQLAPLLAPERLTAEAASLFRLPQRPQLAAALEGCQRIFCPGLFDYLDDDAAVQMFHCLHDRLAHGGALTVFQFAPSNSSRAFMEWVGNWYLLYRDEGEFRRLVASAGFPAALTNFGAEPLGVDLFVRIDRDADP
jgi:extracellular factor (EF) 3-hydroxypalmitic acid methyl ester biosynthesis protein